MATCKDCIHNGVCYHIEHYGRDIETDEPCKDFLSAADVAEVRRGYYERVIDDIYRCSVCHRAPKVDSNDRWVFAERCHNCGAIMVSKSESEKSLMFADLDEIIDSVE